MAVTTSYVVLQVLPRLNFDDLAACMLTKVLKKLPGCGEYGLFFASYLIQRHTYTY